jgi:hypothetical protein
MSNEEATPAGSGEDRAVAFEGAAFGVQLGGLGGAVAAVLMLPAGHGLPAAGAVAAFGFLVSAGLSWLADDDAGLLLAGVALAGALLFADAVGDLRPLAAAGALLVAGVLVAEGRRRGYLASRS